jgi:hypothetical protein
LRSISEGKRLLLKKMSELSFQMHLFRSPPDALIEDHGQVRGPLFYDSGQFAREQVLGCPNYASITQAYTRIGVKEQIAA